MYVSITLWTHTHTNTYLYLYGNVRMKATYQVLRILTLRWVPTQGSNVDGDSDDNDNMKDQLLHLNQSN